MSKILCIDTATDICSVALLENGKVLDSLDSESERSHAKVLAVNIQSILKANSTEVSELDAIAISMGPGSYTGLRIGVSTVKGLCYGANKPMIAISTLESMCYGLELLNLPNIKNKDYYLCPMLDARRMEVYTALFDSEYKTVIEIQALIIDENSLYQFLDKKPVMFFGNGADKLISVIKHPNAHFIQGFSNKAQFMGKLAHEKYQTKNFEDVAYFEPFYLKDFIATVPKKKI
jgi:tRNA threonylcarbamoyladenosine biosynthesis protein TsaB